LREKRKALLKKRKQEKVNVLKLKFKLKLKSENNRALERIERNTRKAREGKVAKEASERIKSKIRKASEVKVVKSGEMKGNAGEVRQRTFKLDAIKVIKEKEAAERIKSRKRKAREVKVVKSGEMKGNVGEVEPNSVNVRQRTEMLEQMKVAQDDGKNWKGEDGGMKMKKCRLVVPSLKMEK